MGRRTAIEWPTLALAALIYGGWAALTFFHDRLPAWLVAAAGVWLVAWHSSLQHEIVHGHPTRWPRLNTALGFLPLSLWLPFARYRTTHLLHHRDDRLTDPLDDPESAYVAAERWRSIGALPRLLILAQATLLGRLLLGPAWRIGHFIGSEAGAVLAGGRERRRILLAHLAAALLVVLWIKAVCGMSLAFYVLGIVYPGTSLLLLRSFAEHRAASRVGERTAIVENARVLGPLFLYNNLHAAHHERPGLAWHRLPRWYGDNRARLVAQNGGLVYDSYLDVMRRFLLRPHDAPLHPGSGSTAAPGAAR